MNCIRQKPLHCVQKSSNDRNFQLSVPNPRRDSRLIDLYGWEIGGVEKSLFCVRLSRRTVHIDRHCDYALTKAYFQLFFRNSKNLSKMHFQNQWPHCLGQNIRILPQSTIRLLLFGFEDFPGSERPMLIGKCFFLPNMAMGSNHENLAKIDFEHKMAFEWLHNWEEHWQCDNWCNHCDCWQNCGEKSDSPHPPILLTLHAEIAPANRSIPKR